MRNSPSVVGLTLNFRDAARTHDCVQSLLADGVCHVLVWDNSEDGGASARVLRAALGAEKRVSIEISPVNLGFAAGVNHGIDWIVQQHPGAWVLLINNDAYLLPGAMAALRDALTNSTVAKLTYPDIDQGGRVTSTVYYQRWFGLLSKHPLPGSDAHASGCCLLLDPARTGSAVFDEDFFMYFEDIDWFWRLQLQNYKFDYAHSCTVRHAGHGSTGGKKLSYDRFLWRNSNTPRMLIKNLRIGTLCWIMPLYYTSYIIEYLLLHILGRRDLARSYVDGMGVFTKNWRSLLKSRRITQHSRTVGDWPILKGMYPGIAKLHGLRSNGLPHLNGRI